MSLYEYSPEQIREEYTADEYASLPVTRIQPTSPFPVRSPYWVTAKSFQVPGTPLS